MAESSQSNQMTDNNKKILVPILAVLLALVFGFLIYLLFQKSNLEETNAQQELQLSRAYDQLDSMTNELSNKIITISQLGGDIDSLLIIKKQLEEEKADFRKRAYKQINDLQQRVDGYKELLVRQDAEIKKLKEINEVLLAENTNLKVEKNTLNDSIRGLKRTKSELENKVAIAGRLAIEDLKIFAVASNGKERDSEFRNRQIEKIKVEFYLAENEIAPIEGKEIRLRIVGPDKNVLFDVTRGSGSFMFEGREMFYTARQEVLYDRKRQKMTFMYEKGSDYALGQHIVELYTDNYQLGKGEFVVK